MSLYLNLSYFEVSHMKISIICYMFLELKILLFQAESL